MCKLFPAMSRAAKDIPYPRAGCSFDIIFDFFSSLFAVLFPKSGIREAGLASNAFKEWYVGIVLLSVSIGDVLPLKRYLPDPKASTPTPKYQELR